MLLPNDVGKSKPATVLKSIFKTRFADEINSKDEMRREIASRLASTCRYTLFLLLAILTAKRLRLPFPGDIGDGNVLRRHYTSAYVLKQVAQMVDRYYLL